MYKGRPLIIGKVPFLRRSFFGLNPFRWYSVTQILGETDSKPLEPDGYYRPDDGGAQPMYWDKPSELEVNNGAVFEAPKNSSGRWLSMYEDKE